jgi:ankyrin repeat protein
MNKLLCAAVLSVPLFAQIVPQRPIEATVSDLSRRPQDFDGRLVRIQAVLVAGWEGDNFLVDPSKPSPLSMPSRDPASLWLYCETGREGTCYKATSLGVVYGTFEGYFHFVPVTHIVNRVFEPGQLQFEVIAATIPSKQPQSLAAASLSGDVDETRRILQSDTSARDDRYLTILLFEAARSGRADFIRELVEEGADLTFNSRDAGTSLMTAAWNCKLDAAQALLAHGAPVNAANMKGETALMYAADTCHDGQMVKLLLDAGANANAATPDNFTALMWATGNPLNAETLLRAGADPTVKNRFGSTAESDNCDRGEAGHAQVCALIREALRRYAGHSQDR